MAKRLSEFKKRQLWWRKTTRNHLERLKKAGHWHPLPRLTLKEWLGRWEEMDHRCIYCLEQFESIRDVWVEHLVGISDGGMHRIENCVPACPPCNQKKGNKKLEEFTGIGSPEEFIRQQYAAIAALRERENVE